jgi:hypothetical protein
MSTDPQRPGPLAIADKPAWDAITAFLQSDLTAYPAPADATFAMLRSLAREGYYVTRYPGC